MILEITKELLEELKTIYEDKNISNNKKTFPEIVCLESVNNCIFIHYTEHYKKSIGIPMNEIYIPKLNITGNIDKEYELLYNFIKKNNRNKIINEILCLQ